MIRRPQFERLWGDSTSEEQAAFNTLLDSANKDGIIKWMKEHPSLELAEKPLSDLKKIAYKIGITNYSRKGKLELVNDIQEQEKLYGTQ